MALATAEDLASYMQQDLDLATATLVLDLAEAAILDTLRLDVMPDPAPAVARGICLDVAKRAYANPLGDITESVGPFSRRPCASGIELFDRERRILRRAVLGADFASVPLESERGGERVEWWTPII